MKIIINIFQKFIDLTLVGWDKGCWGEESQSESSASTFDQLYITDFISRSSVSSMLTLHSSGTEVKTDSDNDKFVHWKVKKKISIRISDIWIGNSNTLFISPLLDDEPDRKEPDFSGGFRGVRPEGRHQCGVIRIYECWWEQYIQYYKWYRTLTLQLVGMALNGIALVIAAKQSGRSVLSENFFSEQN